MKAFRVRKIESLIVAGLLVALFSLPLQGQRIQFVPGW